MPNFHLIICYILMSLMHIIITYRRVSPGSNLKIGGFFMLQINDIHLEINGETLLTVDHLNVQEHKTIGLIGRNGSGKTTFFNHILKNSDHYTDETIQLIPQIKDSDLEKSGGETTQLYLNRALNKDVSIMLLDEPTTHLDEHNSEALLKKLQHIDNIKIIASHDREFLNRIVDEIWSIEDKSIKVYPGNYDKYKEMKNHEIERMNEEYKKYQNKKQQLESAIEGKKRQAHQANRVLDSKIETPYYNKKQKNLHQVAKGMQSRLEQLEEKEKPRTEKSIRFHTQNMESLGHKTIIRIDHENMERGDRTILEQASLFVKAGEKISITGLNGSGKTTLLDHVHKKYKDSSLKLGYFHQQLESLDNDLTIIENVMTSSNYDETTVRTVLARLDIKRDDVYKKIDVSSGGERVKVQLAKILMSDIHVLMLDEPTNFLDIHTIEALENMLRHYPATILLVSHDKRFRENVTEINYDIKDKKLISDKTAEPVDDTKEALMVTENRITEVLGRLSVEPSEELDQEFKRLIKEKRVLLNRRDEGR